MGGRDLSAEVGGLATLRGIGLLEADESTEVVVVVSKPPDAEVAERIARAAREAGKPAVLALLGARGSFRGADVVESLEEAARRAAELAGGRLSLHEPDPPTPPREGAVRGLFCGGTLCQEAMQVVAAAMGAVRSNIPLRPEWALPDVHSAEGHAFVDFGDDVLTEGRAHPMIDPTLRMERLGRELGDPEVGAVVLDVVLGFGAHPDPAGELAAVLGEAPADRPHVVVSLCGARGDPQGLEAQAERLRGAGGTVARGAAAAARLALRATGKG